MKSLKSMLWIGGGMCVIVLLIVFHAEVIGALARFRAALGAAADPAFTYGAFKDLERENMRLKTEGELKTLAGANPHSYRYRVARVYSRYPVGSGGRLAVNAGSEDGIQEGMPVLLSEGILIGKAVVVRRTQSEVETVWSPAWKSAVTVTAPGLKALLQGGTEPRLALVPKDTSLAGGERVLNTSPEFPLGLLVGTVGDALQDTRTGLWSSYRLLPPAKEGEIETVLVVLDFP